MKSPIYIQIKPEDNVAIIVSEGGILKGTKVSKDITALQDIPQAHKIVLKDIEKEGAIIRYGAIIGYAKETLLKGRCANEHNMLMPTPPKFEDMQIATQIVAQNDVPEQDKTLTFMGYANLDGTVGTKNLLGIMTCVQCVEGVVNLAIKKLEALLPQYPEVDGIMPINHNYGCGVAIDAPEAIIPIRTLRNLGTHPNFGGELLIVGLGCEKLPPERIIPDVSSEQVIILQDYQGFETMVDIIVAKGIKVLEKLSGRKREPRPLSDLIIGVQCGGSDAFTGITSNPAIGHMADLLVAHGAKVAFSEVTEVRDGVHLLTKRAINEAVGNQLIEEMRWYDNYLTKGGVGREANTTPGNKKGGLANIVEKSLGSIAKSGTSPIMDVVSCGEKMTTPGLNFVATPASDFVCGTLQLAAGITLQVFSTGRGTPYGLKMAPVIKVSSNSTLKEKWRDLIDMDAGRIVDGQGTIDSIGKELFDVVIQVASGQTLTAADRFKIENAICLFNPAPIT